jgi:hypothetical protein
VAQLSDTGLHTPFESKNALLAQAIQTLSFHVAQRLSDDGLNAFGS